MKCISFILDAGQQIGLGHLSRCLALARFGKKRGVSSVFLCPRDSALTTLGPAKGPEFDWVTLPFGLNDSTSLDEWQHLQQKIGFDVLVIDLWEHQCRPLSCLQGNQDFGKVLLSGFPLCLSTCLL